jgi:hypothetical protein
MHAQISTQLDCTEHALWQLISKPQSLQFVASPILGFTPLEPGALDGEWQVGREYRLKLYLLRVIPLGQHSIELVQIDREHNSISSRERGQLTRVWNHNIFFEETSPGRLSYTDQIEIRAGWLTPFIWMFAQLFYRHRQRRWKVLLQKERARGPAQFR